MGSLLPKDYFLDTDACFLAKDLLGKILFTSMDDGITSGIIVETEAYRGPEDQASHSYNFRRTARNETMYREGGLAYVYICYGIHHLFNVVTAPEGVPHAVLIRALEPLEGADLMWKRRPGVKHLHHLTRGPGSLSRAMGITLAHNTLPLWSEKSEIGILDTGYRPETESIKSSPRIGVEYAGPSALLPWRYFLDHPSVSAHRRANL